MLCYITSSRLFWRYLLILLIGTRRVNLLTDAPEMCTLREMHRHVAKHPSIQAELFLLMEECVQTELLCVRNAFMGRKSLAGQVDWPEIEDDYATTGEPGIGNILRSLLKPIEAQGRGFSHGHQKSNSAPQLSAARLKDLFLSLIHI